MEKNMVRQFITSGRAILTCMNNQTGNHRTFKINQSKDKKVFFVSIRGNKDRSLTDRKNWSKLGMIKNNNFQWISTAEVPATSNHFKSFHWFWRASLNWEKSIDPYPFIQVDHEGRCGRCGRQLTDPDSISAGFGPECIKKI